MKFQELLNWIKLGLAVVVMGLALQLNGHGIAGPISQFVGTVICIISLSCFLKCLIHPKH